MPLAMAHVQPEKRLDAQGPRAYRVLVEMGSLTNGVDLATLQDPVRQQDFARALFDGLQAFFGTFSGASQ